MNVLKFFQIHPSNSGLKWPITEQKTSEQYFDKLYKDVDPPHTQTGVYLHISPVENVF